jgi:hypothetical protein
MRSNVKTGRGCIVIHSNRGNANKPQPAPQTQTRPDPHFASPATAATIRQRYIDAGIIKTNATAAAV